MGITQSVQVMNIEVDSDGNLKVSDETIEAKVELMFQTIFKIGVMFDDILNELKITNMHLSILTDNVIDNKEIRE